MTDPRHIEWSKAVRNKYGYKCVACGKYTRWCHAHHLDGYDWAISARFDVDNGVALCPGKYGCHMDFHKIYGNKNNNREQFAEYLSVYYGKSLSKIIK